MSEEITDKQFIDAGFKPDTEDPQFLYHRDMITDEQAENQGVSVDDRPMLLFGAITGIGLLGFCIYTGSHFIWFNAVSPAAAVEFADLISNIEECYHGRA